MRATAIKCGDIIMPEIKILKVAKMMQVSQRTGKQFKQLQILAETENDNQLFSMLFSTQLMMELMLNGVVDFDNMTEVQTALQKLADSEKLTTSEEYQYSLMLVDEE